jgi:hypothetical protein
MSDPALDAIRARYGATLNGASSNPGVYYESSKDVPYLLERIERADFEMEMWVGFVAKSEARIRDMERMICPDVHRVTGGRCDNCGHEFPAAVLSQDEPTVEPLAPPSPPT